VLLRKHLLLYFEKHPEGNDDRFPLGSLPEESQRIDLVLFHQRSMIFAHAIGVNDLVGRTDELVLSTLHRLRYLQIPPSVHVTGEILDFLVEHTRISVADLKQMWLENTATCSCTVESRKNDTLAAAYKESTINRLIQKEKHSLKLARQKVAQMSERDLTLGMFRLALEVWSLDYDLTNNNSVTSSPLASQESLDEMFEDPSQIPPTMKVITDGSGRPLTVVPSRSAWPSTYELSGGSSEGDIDSGLLQSKNEGDVDEYGVDYRFDLSAQLDHPYVQRKMAILVSDRGYSTDVASKIILWSLLPPNSIIPFNLLIAILQSFHQPYVTLGPTPMTEE
jgi:hypothetical protein